MFQNAAIDVAIALILMYLMLGLLCTVINEFIATKLRLRAKSLASTLAKLLDDPALRGRFYQHGLIVTSMQAAATGAQSIGSAIRSIGRDKTTKKDGRAPVGATAAATGAATGGPALVPGVSAPAAPMDHPSYLSSRSVALAVIGSLDTATPLPVMPDIRDAVKRLPDSYLRDALLSSLIEAGDSIDKLRGSIATWFDDSMERLSGAYKRQLKWISMVVGLLVAVAFNADSFTVATTLWTDQARRASVVEVATKLAQATAPKTPEAVDEAKLRETIKKTEDSLRSLPIGWSWVCPKQAAPANPPADTDKGPGVWTCAKETLRLHPVTLLQVLGWLLTAAALTVGAPFWFDLLQKFVNIRGAGSKPKREDEK